MINKKGSDKLKEQTKTVILKITSMCMIIGGSVAIIIATLAVNKTFTHNTIDDLIVRGYHLPTLYLSIFLTIATSVAQIVIGIIGLNFYSKLEKLEFFTLSGIVILICATHGNFLALMSTDHFSYISFAIGFVLPILFIIGSSAKRKSQCIISVQTSIQTI